MNESQNKRNNKKLKTMCEVAVMVAVALALSYIELELGAAGGSVGLVMIPIFVVCFRHGLSWGLVAGLVFGTLKCLFTEGIGYGWQAILLDYSVAYLACGLCGLWKNPKVSGVVAGTLAGSAARWFIHTLSGVVLWGEYMPAEYLGMAMHNVWLYSMLYNGIYMSLNCALAVVVLVLLRKKAPILFETN